MSSSAVTLSYHTVGGSIGSVCAEGIGVTSLLRDALGNIATTSSNTLPSETSRFYAAYGTQLGDTTEGSDYQFGWIGALGYHRQSLKHAEEYVRARTYGVSEARWTSVDPLWPEERAYSYSSGNPTNMVDPSGLKCQVGCSEADIEDCKFKCKELDLKYSRCVYFGNFRTCYCRKRDCEKPCLDQKGAKKVGMLDLPRGKCSQVKRTGPYPGFCPGSGKPGIHITFSYNCQEFGHWKVSIRCCDCLNDLDDDGICCIGKGAPSKYEH